MSTNGIGSTDTAGLSAVLIQIASGLFALAASVILVILVSRLVKTARHKREHELLSVLMPSLNGLLFGEGDISQASHLFNLNEIKKVVRGDRLATQLLVTQIVNLKKNLRGSPAKMLDAIYDDLGLHEFSSRKLSSWSWNVRAQGIRELSELNHRHTLDVVRKMTHTKNRTLREELLLSTIRLDEQNPLGFLDQWDGQITSWMRIHIHHYLSRLEKRAIPDFSKWFSSQREDVVIFSISMALEFQQSNTAPELAKLLAHSNPTVVRWAVDALTEFEAFSFVDTVVKYADLYRSNEKVSCSIAMYLGKTGHSAEHLEVLAMYLHHSSLSVRLEAVRALLLLGNDGNSVLRRQDDGTVRNLIIHASEPLLK